MNAMQARKITSEHLRLELLSTYIRHIDARVVKAGKKGTSTVYNPHIGSQDEGFAFTLNDKEKEALKRHYESEYFTWKEFDDPDPGNPISSPYITLSW